MTGPAAWWHGWRRDDWDALAGAVAAGHVIECGPQATGGNYSFLDEITDRRYPGFPIAEVAADGSSVITKHEGTGGLVSPGTVTAQLLYEIGDPAYLNPDVVAHFDTIRLEQAGPDRVALTGTRGSPPPDTLKVALNMLGGYRNTMTMVLTGLDIEQKAEHADHPAVRRCSAATGSSTRSTSACCASTARTRRPTSRPPPTCGSRSRTTDERKVGRAFSNATHGTRARRVRRASTPRPRPPRRARSASTGRRSIPAALVTRAVHAAGRRNPGRSASMPPRRPPRRRAAPPASRAAPPRPRPPPPGPARRRSRSGRLCGARSGDKGGDANVGLWAASPGAYAWLRGYLTADRLRDLLTEAAAPGRSTATSCRTCCALNFVVHGLLAPGVSATTRPDAQAKGLGEYLRSRIVTVPADLAARPR